MSSATTTVDENTLLQDTTKSLSWRDRMRHIWYRTSRTSRMSIIIVIVTLIAVAVGVGIYEATNSPDAEPHKGITKDSERRTYVRNAMQHAWGGYSQYAFGYDELKPLSNSSDDKWGGWGITMIDALDTLYIMEMYEEFNTAVRHISKVDFARTTPNYKVSFFEMVIRSLGGLLSAYEMSLDKRLLEKAQQVGDALAVAFDTPSGIPYNSVDINAGHAVNSSRISIAEAGTVQLEYWKLSELTGNSTYHKLAQRVIDILDKDKKPHKGLYPVLIDTSTGKLTHSQITFGGQGDSFYEYLLKQYILSGQTHDQYRRMYEESIDSMKQKMVSRSLYDSQMYYIGDMDSTATKFSPRFQHLTCFAPGMLALGSKVLDRPDDLEYAKRITYTCFQMYNRTHTGLSAEYVLFREKKNQGVQPDVVVKDVTKSGFIEESTLDGPTKEEMERGFYFGSNKDYILRPEVVESLMYMYRITGDPVYKDWGWQIFLAIDRYTKTRAAFAAYNDVTNTDKAKEQRDSMESFFLAETLKYLYLLFSPVDYYSLDDYVFNTEAHPYKLLGVSGPTK